ncbi:MAG: caspase family protein [Sedimentisphaerales bacterium]|nr:caspase family protein [Sedimentisphaerales bacterium]
MYLPDASGGVVLGGSQRIGIFSDDVSILGASSSSYAIQNQSWYSMESQGTSQGTIEFQVDSDRPWSLGLEFSGQKYGNSTLDMSGSVYDSDRSLIQSFGWTFSSQDNWLGTERDSASFSPGRYYLDLDLHVASQVSLSVPPEPGQDPMRVESLATAQIVADAAPREPGVYGLFVGVDEDKAAGAADALKLYNTISTNLANWRDGLPLIRDTKDGGVTSEEIEIVVNRLLDEMSPGDTFIFYGAGHGTGKGNVGATDHQDETTVNTGDEALLLSANANDYLFDDTLTRILSSAKMQEMQKWVILDACGSGGFWGNNNPDDEGDLEKLTNIDACVKSWFHAGRARAAVREIR